MKLEHPESERSVLHALAAVSAVRPAEALQLVESCRLVAEDFAAPAHADVYRAATDFLARGVPLELFALEAALTPSSPVKAAGGRAWLAALLMEPRPGGAVAEHARLVRDASLRRRAIETLRGVAKRVQDPELSPADVLALGAEAWSGLTNRGRELATSEGDVLRLGEMLDAAQKGRRELVIPTGIHALDEAIGGLQPSVLTLVGALPGVGKSALLATILRNVAGPGRRVGFFSLEDERTWVARRWLSLASRVPLFLLATRPLTDQQRDRTEAAGPSVYEALRHVVIDDRQGLTAKEVAAAASDMILNFGCRAILVDHLGELRLERTERYDLDIAEALQLLRDVAKRHCVPVVVASHVRRRQGLGVEDAPCLTDFANSSAPERMSRVALGLSKPSDGSLRVTVLKQTNGKSGQDVELSLVPFAAMVDSGSPNPSPPDWQDP